VTKLLKPEEAAELLGVTPHWVRQAARDGAIPAIKLGKFWRFDQEALAKFIEQSGTNDER
jgi:excisionase family DNA binding protein